MKPDNYTALRVKHPTHKKVKIAALQANMTIDEYISNDPRL